MLKNCPTNYKVLANNRYDARRVPQHHLNTAISILGLLVLIFVSIAAWDAYAHYRGARRTNTANHAMETLMQSAVARARERGLSALVLGAGTHERFRGKIEATRRAVDRLWGTALPLAEELASDADAGGQLALALGSARLAHARYLDARTHLDARWAGHEVNISIETWLTAATETIRRDAQLREAVGLLTPLPTARGQLNQRLRSAAWTASEHAGWSRGALAYYLAADKPVPAPIREELQSHRREVLKNVNFLMSERDNRMLDSTVRESLSRVAEGFVARVLPLQADLLSASHTGDYSLDAETWWKQATRGIETLVAVAQTAAGVSRQRTEGAMARSRRILIGYSAGAVCALIITVFSLTRVRRIANDLFEQKELAEVTVRSIGDAVITIGSNGRIKYINPVAEQLTAWSLDQARGRPISQVFRVINATTRQPALNPAEMCLQNGDVVHLANNTLLIAGNGKEIPIEDSGAPIHNRDGDIIGAILVFYDSRATERHAHTLLSYQATHDPLTGLVNRREVERRLNELIERAFVDNVTHALCYIDLDQFKVVNDTCGHAAGDRLLRQLTLVMKENIREGDTLARLGGDEFVVLLSNCALQRAGEISRKLLRTIQEFHFVWEDRSFAVSASIGVALITATTANVSEVLSEADAACFVAKEKGRSRVELYQPDNVEVALRHSEMHWVSRIQEALASDAFKLFAQPIRSLNGGQTEIIEILVRMLDTEGQPISPMSFIPAAERYNLMPALDRWVIENTLSQISSWHRGMEWLHYNINLSGTSVSDPTLPAFIQHQLRCYKISPGDVCFEITETAAISNMDQAVALMDTLRGDGCRFALDDFGTGLSSFGYLKRLRANYIKIDGSLIERVAEDPDTRAIITAIHQVSRSMNAETVAESVSDHSTIAALRKLGIDYAQGFALGAPRPLTELLRRHS